MPMVNHAATVAEVTTLCEAYEHALVANDIAALKAFFWDSPHAIRYGVDGQLYGAEAISAFRESRVIDFTGRQPLRLNIVAFGTDAAVAMLEYSVLLGGDPRHGRQTQVWVRFPETGWRITSAHISFVPPDPSLASILSAASAVGLNLDPEHRAGVAAQYRRTTEIVAPLLAFALPDTGEPAPVFTP